MLSVGGATAASWAAGITSGLAGVTNNVRWALINLGANDVSALPAEATWKADMATILDAINAKWPLAKVYIMRPWRQGEAADCNSLATWIADIVAARSSWAFVGPDERVFLENGDDGATYTSDGVHPTDPAGYLLTVDQWKTVLGY